jgi:hypothetical protein
VVADAPIIVEGDDTVSAGVFDLCGAYHAVVSGFFEDLYEGFGALFEEVVS